MFLKIFNLIFWVGMIFFLGGITFMFVMDPEVTSDEFWIYFYGVLILLVEYLCWDGILYINF